MREQNNNESSEDKNKSELEKVGTFNWTKVFKLFLLRLPLWVVVLIALLSGSWFGYSKITKEEPVNLRPAITNARSVEIVITTCNEEIDRQGFDIRTEEKNLEKDLEEIEGVKAAEVLIERDRDNCENPEEEK